MRKLLWLNQVRTAAVAVLQVIQVLVVTGQARQANLPVVAVATGQPKANKPLSQYPTSLREVGG